MCFDLDLRSGGFCQHSRYHPLLFATKSQDVIDFLLYPCQACSLLNPTRESIVIALKHMSVHYINRNINENKFEDFWGGNFIFFHLKIYMYIFKFPLRSPDSFFYSFPKEQFHVY